MKAASELMKVILRVIGMIKPSHLKYLFVYLSGLYLKSIFDFKALECIDDKDNKMQMFCVDVLQRWCFISMAATL